MSDLIERLRRGEDDIDPACLVMGEAADELERLSKLWIAETREIARLRAALKECADVLAVLTGPDQSVSAMHVWAQSVSAESKARAVLMGSPHSPADGEGR